MKLKWEQNVATTCLRRAYHGSFIAERLVQNKHLVTSKGEYKGLSHLRRKLNEYMSLGEYVEDVTKDLLLRAAELSGGKAKAASTTNGLNAVVASASGAPSQIAAEMLESVKEMGRTSTKSKRSLFNEPAPKLVRLDQSLGHFPVQWKATPKKCAYCTKHKRAKECAICGVVLCIENDDGTLCFKEFHVHDTL
jgi:hypothetical protein